MSDEPVTLKRVGVRMYLPPACQRVTPVIRAERTWEPSSTQWVLEHLCAGDTFVDVGAHVGYYTLLAAKAVGDGGRVYAFEPDPGNFALLVRNVELNGFRNVVLENKAVAARPGARRLYLSPNNSGDHRLEVPGEGRASVEVEAVCLDEYLAGRRVDFVKIDTQGAEAEVLLGMKGTILANRHLVMLVEFWPYGLSCFGSTGRELLDSLVVTGQQIPPQEHQRLLELYTVENRRHTNLMLRQVPRFEATA